MQSCITSLEEPVSVAQYVSSIKNGEKKAIMSGGDSDSGDLSLSCTVSCWPAIIFYKLVGVVK